MNSPSPTLPRQAGEGANEGNVMKVELLQPHTHAGKDYPAGSIIEIDRDRAEWLIAIGVARKAAIQKPSKGE